MKLSQNRKSARKGFTLIEMIGVLAVIAILASLLIPKIYEAINNARINNAVVSYNTVKTAVADHYAKYGGIDRTTNGAAIPAGSLAFYDKALLIEGFLDKLFLTKVGSTSWVEVVSAPSGAGVGYDLAGVGGNDVSGATYVVEAVIQGVPASDARDINDRLDGGNPPFNVTLGADDFKGRVKYSNGTQNVWIYITHR